jgi:hypothetical protein
MKVRFGIHPRMEDADNSDQLLKHAIEDDVLTNATVAETAGNVIPCWSKVRMHEQFVHGSHEPIGIKISLLRSPSRIGVSEQRAKVDLGVHCELKPRG